MTARRGQALVTGGAGFIGSHLVGVLLDAGRDVTVVDDLSTGRRENLVAHDAARVIEADLATALPGLRAEEFEEVYHLAAAVGVERIMHDPVAAIETNVGQTDGLLRWAAAAGERSPIVQIASSSEVYGKGSSDPFHEDDDVVYGPTTVARWSYGCSKAIDEFLALGYARRDGLRVVVTRFFNTVGPRQTGRYGMVLPRFVRAALAGDVLHVYGDGRQSRCFCDVRDVARALPRLLAEPSCHGRIFNVGSDREISVRGLAELVLHTLGREAPIRHVEYDQAYGPGFEDLRRRRPDLSRIRSAIGFSPAISLERTIEDIAAWMSQGERL